MRYAHLIAKNSHYAYFSLLKLHIAKFAISVSSTVTRRNCPPDRYSSLLFKFKNHLQDSTGYRYRPHDALVTRAKVLLRIVYHSVHGQRRLKARDPD